VNIGDATKDCPVLAMYVSIFRKVKMNMWVVFPTF